MNAIIILLTIVIGLQVLNIGMFFMIINYIRNVSKTKEPVKEKSPINTFTTHIMKYALEKGLKCMIMPDQNAKSTLFEITDNGMIAICNLIATTHGENTNEFKTLLKQMTDKIDYYVENKDLIKSKIKEEKNAAS